MTKQISHIPRSLKLLRAAPGDWHMEVVEAWGKVGPRWQRKDLHGCIDIEMYRSGCVVGVQVCGATGWAAHATKTDAAIRGCCLDEKYDGLLLLAWRKQSGRYQFKAKWALVPIRPLTVDLWNYLEDRPIVNRGPWRKP